MGGLLVHNVWGSSRSWGQKNGAAPQRLRRTQKKELYHGLQVGFVVALSPGFRARGLSVWSFQTSEHAEHLRTMA